EEERIIAMCDALAEHRRTEPQRRAEAERAAHAELEAQAARDRLAAADAHADSIAEAGRRGSGTEVEAILAERLAADLRASARRSATSENAGRLMPAWSHTQKYAHSGRV